MIGAKTLVAIVFVALAGVAAGVRGLLDPSYLSHLSPEACLVIGIFAALGGAMVSRFGRLGEPSRAYLGLRDYRKDQEIRIVGALIMGGRSDVRPRDIPGILRTGGLAFVFLCIGLVTFDNRSVGLLTEIPTRMSALSVSEYCAEKKPSAAPAKTKLVAAPGCALILRAYRLGYTKKLGNCAPKEVTEVAAKKKLEICRDRQQDEPILHYAWRLVSEKAAAVAEVNPRSAFRDGMKQFEVKLGYVSSLLANQAHAIRASPRSSHHIWTNLPNPNPTSLLTRWFVPQNCSSRFTKLAINVRWKDSQLATSQVLDHAAGQLLFNPRFGPPPGYCRDYVIHWGAPMDSCKRLVAKPTAFLDDTDALEPVNAVLDRHKRLEELVQLSADLKRKHPAGPPQDLARVISFHCFMIDPAGDGKVRHDKITISGSSFSVRQLHAKPSAASGAGQLATYRHVASLLTGGGHYAGPVSDDPLSRATGEPPNPEDMKGEDYPLTKLEMLRAADPFLGAPWPLDRDDLLEVYPFHVHLRNFVEVFRRNYRTQRGRL